MFLKTTSKLKTLGNPDPLPTPMHTMSEIGVIKARHVTLTLDAIKECSVDVDHSTTVQVVKM